MARREKPLTVTGPVTEFAAALRDLRHRAQLTYRDMGERSGRTPSALSIAASGDSVPSWQTAEAYIRACGEDPGAGSWRELWEAAAATVANPTRPGGEEELAHLHFLLRAARVQAGDPPLRQLSSRAGIPVSTLASILQGNRLPRLELVTRLLDAYDSPKELRVKVSAAWRSAALARQAARPSRVEPTARPTGPATVTPIRTLPRGTTSFVGRERELARLLADSHESRGTADVTVIEGTAGIGKTALAVHAAHRIADRFRDGQLYLDFHTHTPAVGPESPSDLLERALGALGVWPEFIPADLDLRAALYRSRLTGTRTLLLLDDVESEEQVRPLLPAVEGCRVLITSRKRLRGLQDVDVLVLEALSLEESVTLLCRDAGIDPPSEPEALEEVAYYCQYLPLALRIAASWLRHRPAWTTSDLAAALRDPSTRLGELRAGDLSVADALKASYDGLTSDQQAVLQYAGLHPGPDFDAFALSAAVGLDVHPVRQLLESLVDRSLITERSRGRYSLHDLVRQFAVERARQDMSAEDIESAESRLTDYYQQAAQVALGLLAEPRNAGVIPAEIASVRMPEITSADQATQWLDRELPNLQAVVAHFGGRTQVLARIVAVLSPDWVGDGSLAPKGSK